MKNLREFEKECEFLQLSDLALLYCKEVQNYKKIKNEIENKKEDVEEGMMPATSIEEGGGLDFRINAIGIRKLNLADVLLLQKRTLSRSKVRLIKMRIWEEIELMGINANISMDFEGNHGILIDVRNNYMSVHDPEIPKMTYEDWQELG